MRGVVPGRAFEALARIIGEQAVPVARGAVDRADLTDQSLALILSATATIEGESARSAVREIVERRVEVLGDPKALDGALKVWPSKDLPALFALLARALQWQGVGRSVDLLRAVTDHVEADDTGWCLRTGPDGRINLRKTIKAVESAYDCELEGPAPSLAPEAIREISHVLRSREPAAAIQPLAALVDRNLGSLPSDPTDPLPGRIAALASALTSEPFMAEAGRLGPVFTQGIVTVLLSFLFKVARYRNYAREVEAAGTDTEALLALADEETVFMLDLLPGALARSVEAARGDEGPARKERILEWCRRMLEARGPYFPKALVIETIGALRAEDHIPELLDALADENTYVFTAAEKSLARMGPAIIGPARARLEAGALEHEALHSLLVLLVDIGDQAALSLVLDHFDDFVESVGPGETAEWSALLGSRELFAPIHGLLQRDVARVGQALLLLGAIHNIPVPEEAQIEQAIDDYWRRHAPGPGAGGEDEGGSGSYLM